MDTAQTWTLAAAAAALLLLVMLGSEARFVLMVGTAAATAEVSIAAAVSTCI